MGDVSPTTRKQSLQMAGVIAGSVLALNGAFFVLSNQYFKTKPELAADINGVRIAFAAMTLAIAIAAFGASVAPRKVGHGLSILLGVASFVGGIAGIVSGFQIVVSITLLVCGVLLALLTLYSLRHSRPAWSFLIAILSVLATVTFFGAPKIRKVLDIGLWEALTIPGLMTVAVVALSTLRTEYKGRA